MCETGTAIAQLIAGEPRRRKDRASIVGWRSHQARDTPRGPLQSGLGIINHQASILNR